MVNKILQPVEQQPCSALALRGIGTSVPGEHDEHKALSIGSGTFRQHRGQFHRGQ